MTLIDTHCHLYLPEFEEDITEVISRAKQQGINRFYLPAIDSEAHQNMLAIEEKFAGECIAMMGLHPCSVKENFTHELQIVKEWLRKRRFAAIGEIGLDFYWSTEFAKHQYEAFEMQMQWALEINLPVVIHSRNAMQQTIDAVKPFADKGLKGIFHCFSGDAEAAQQIVAMGFYLGIGGVLTYKNSEVATALENIPVEYMVLETDAPYLSPVPYRGKRNESSYLQYVAKKLAEIKHLTIEDVAAVTTATAQKIFGD